MPKHKIDMPKGAEVRFWWALAWRQLVAVPASGILGGAVGAVIGLVLGLLGGIIGLPEQLVLRLITLIGGLLGVTLGLGLNFLFVKDVLGREFNGWVLAFVPAENLASASASDGQNHRKQRNAAKAIYEKPRGDGDSWFADDEPLSALGEDTEDIYSPLTSRSAYVRRAGKVHPSQLSTPALRKLRSEGKLLPSDELAVSEEGPWIMVSRVDFG